MQAARLSEIIKQWLLLANSRMSGPQIVELIKRFESADAVLQAGEAKLQKAGVTPAAAERLAKPDMTAIEKALQWLDEPQHHIVHYASPDYPALLRQIADAPALIYVNGNPDSLHLPALAIVIIGLLPVLLLTRQMSREETV